MSLPLLDPIPVADPLGFPRDSPGVQPDQAGQLSRESSASIFGLAGAVFMGERFYRWLSDLVTLILRGVIVGAPSVHRSGLSSSLAATTFFTPTTPGAVRISLGLQVTLASGATSSIAGDLTWVVGGVTQTKSIAALVTNTTTTRDEIDALVYPDTAQPIKYSTTYASTGAPAMQYTLTASAEALP